MIKNIILDPGHGGIDRTGKYTTAGKQYKFKTGEVALEGVINRRITRKLGYHITMQSKLKALYTVHPNNSEDISLGKRMNIANAFNTNNDSLFISIHNNAAHKAGSGSGFEIFTTTG
jgi:N-acetylmuramoyl-L-alanine amidase